MATSYNGWSASPNPTEFGGLTQIVVAGENFPPGVRAGDVATVFQYLAEQLHKRVEPIVRADWHQGDDWGYSFRPNVNAPSTLSCHASGTAIDYNATRHPNGKRGTFNAEQTATIRRILTELRGVVEWGGNFKGTADEMHFEICKGASEVRIVANWIRGVATPGAPGVSSSPFLEYGMHGPEVKRLQEILTTRYPAYAKWSPVTDYFGEQTLAAVKEFQRRSGLVADGIVGPATRRALGM
jgi:hypothetical protein